MSGSQSPRLPRLPQPVETNSPSDPVRILEISPHQNTSLHHYDQDVVRELSIPPQSVNPSATTQSPYYHPNGFPTQAQPEATTSSYLTSPFPHNVSLATFPSRPRTPQSSIFAQHGLPESLPPPPRTTFYSQPSVIPSTENTSDNLVSYFDNLLTGSYSQMLSEKPDNTVSSESAPAAPPSGESHRAAPRSSQTDLCPPAPRLYCSPLPRLAELSLDDMFNADYFENNEYLTSPLIQDDSPEETPFLDTPYENVWSSPMVDAGDDSYDMGEMPLFGAGVKRQQECTDAKPNAATESLDVLGLLQLLSPAEPAASPSFQSSKMDPVTPSMDPLDSASMYTIPQTPAIHPASLYHSPRLPSTLSLTPSSTPSDTSATAATSNRTRPAKPIPTGTRRNITPAALVPLDAPTQARQYVTPSATSRKAVPAAFTKGKKRARSEVDGGDDEDEAADEVHLDPNTAEAIEAKRRQNTLAARRSRQRKLNHVRVLEESLETMKQDRDTWMARAYDAEAKLRAHNLVP